MRTRPTTPKVAATRLIVGALALTTTGCGRPAPPAQSQDAPAPPAPVAPPVTDVDRGRALMDAGDLAGAEEILWRAHLDALAAAPTTAPTALTRAALRELSARNPCRATARLHDGPVTALAISDAGVVVTAGADGMVTKWLPDTGDTARVRMGPAETNVALAGDGSRAARWNNDFIEVFDLANGDWIGRVDAFDVERVTLSISRSGEHVVAAHDRFVSLWSAGGEHIREIQIQRRPRAVHAVAAGHEGRRVVTAEGGVLKFFDESAVREVATVSLEGRPTLLAMSADGERLAAVAGTAVHVFAADGRAIGVAHHEDAVAVAGLDPAGRVLATGGASGRVRISTPGDDGAPVTIGVGHSGAVTAVAVGPDARWVVSGDDTGTVKLWEPTDAADPAHYDAFIAGNLAYWSYRASGRSRSPPVTEAD